MKSQVVVLSIVGVLVSSSALFGADRLVPSVYPTIQAGIDAAIEGDTVIIEPGTYNELTNFNGKPITVRSTDPNDPSVVAGTIIDGTGLGGSVVSCISGEGRDTVLSGCTIKGGAGTSSESRLYFFGGGMYNVGSSPTVTNCTFSGNKAEMGKGMYNDWGSPAVTNCTFVNNRPGYEGGGMLNEDASPIVTNCTFSSNGALGGGGMSNHGGSPTVTNCTFSGNEGGLLMGGGGMRNVGSSPTVTNCTFTNNMGGTSGGGVQSYEGSPTVTNCTFSDNYAEMGGGMVNQNGMVTNCVFSGNSAGLGGNGGGMVNQNGMVTNCVFSGNSAGLGGNGGGMVNQNGMVTNCTFIQNRADDGTGGGMVNSGQATNCILWGNTPNQILGSGSVTFSAVQGGYAGAGNIDADPLFVSGPEGDYYLSQIAAGQAVDSPCVDTGSDLAANLGMDVFTTRTDEIGDAAIVDMGYHYPMPNPADIDGDGDVDFVDYAILASQCQQAPGVPSADIAPPGGDGIVDGKDLGLLGRNWLWGK